jgi:MraZ protein
MEYCIIIVGRSGGKWGNRFKGKEERMYFIGNDIYSVDHKGRVFIPAKFRSVLTEDDEGSFYIVRGFETSLLLFPLSGWNEFVKELSGKKYSQKSVREAIRAFSYAAERLSMDSQGRVVLPGELRDYSRIEDEVFFLGAINKIELWSPVVYEEYSKGSGDINELYSKLGM